MNEAFSVGEQEMWDFLKFFWLLYKNQRDKINTWKQGDPLSGCGPNPAAGDTDQG